MGDPAFMEEVRTMFMEKGERKELEKRVEKQRNLILDLLIHRSGGVTNIELIRMGILRPAARIEELRKEGHIIDTVHVKGGIYKYVYRGRHPKEEEQNNIIYVIKDGERRAKKSVMGSISVILSAVKPEQTFFDTLVFVRGGQERGKSSILVFRIKEGKEEVIRLKDTAEDKKRISELIKDSDFLVARRVRELQPSRVVEPL
jgi:hypothetical protein